MAQTEQQRRGARDDISFEVVEGFGVNEAGEEEVQATKDVGDDVSEVQSVGADEYISLVQEASASDTKMSGDDAFLAILTGATITPVDTVRRGMHNSGNSEFRAIREKLERASLAQEAQGYSLRSTSQESTAEDQLTA
jgi:hypothetical protein